jgi:two-component system KDP operon response regulator KdpE
MSTAAVVVVGDEPQFRRTICAMLSADGYDIRETKYAEALTFLTEKRADLVLVDVHMPGRQGLEVCRKLRRASNLPMVVLSRSGDHKDKIHAIAAGADEYIVKPFGPDELLARIRSLLRRSGSVVPDLCPASTNGGHLVIDSDKRTLTVRGQDAHLSPKEFEVLTYLLANRGRLVTHAELAEIVWGPRSTQGTHDNLRVVINKLRKKIESDPAHPRYIVTEPWIGYRFDSGAEVSNRGV